MGGAARFSRYLARDQRQFIVLILPCALFLLAFIYLPMAGLVLAFKSFNVSAGIWKSPWVGLENFRFFITSEYAWRATKNTILLNLLFIGSNHLFALFCAIGLDLIRSRLFRKAVQTITYFPSFLSWVIVGVLASAFFSPSQGLLNQILRALRMDTVQWYMHPEYWPFILDLINVWKNAGVLIIIYVAALTVINPEYYEAARMDGAGLGMRIRCITLPLIMPTIVVLLLMAVGNIFRFDCQMMISLVNRESQLYPTTDVLDFFVYRSLMNSMDVGMPAAVGLYQSIVGFICVFFANRAARKYQSAGALF
jgi:putative aldouronate transport system permease protein